MECDCRECQGIAEETCDSCDEHIYDCICDSYEEEEDGHGYSTVTPWEKRGITVTGITNDSNWEEAWPVLGKGHKKFDPCQRAADFYLLEALSNNIPAFNGTSEIKKINSIDPASFGDLFDGIEVDLALVEEAYKVGKEKVESSPELMIGSLMGQAELELETLVESTDEILVEYFHMAVAGEARHHKAVGGRILSGSSNRSAAWVGWKKVYAEIGEDALMDLHELFLEFDDGSFGGVPWAQACEVLHERLTGKLGPDEYTNKKMFIDRAWTLEHNGGCFLNKIGWTTKNDKGWGLDYLKSRVLDAHASNPTNFKLLLKVASKKVVELYSKYYDAQNAYRKIHGLELISNLVTEKAASKTLCYHCSSNPEIGHGFKCLNKPKKTITVEEDEFDSYNWNFHDLKGNNSYPLDADKNLLPGKYSTHVWYSASTEDEIADKVFNKTHIAIKEGQEKDLLSLAKAKVQNHLEKENKDFLKDGSFVTISMILKKDYDPSGVGIWSYNLAKSMEYKIYLYFTVKDGKLTDQYKWGATKNNVVLKTATAPKKMQTMWTYELAEITELPASKAKIITVESMVS